MWDLIVELSVRVWPYVIVAALLGVVAGWYAAAETKT